MPLNDDPDALSDDDYWAMFSEDDVEPCQASVPPDALADALVRLDDADDYRNDGPPRG